MREEMPMARRSMQDIVAGGLAVLIGLAFFVMSFEYGIGTARAMEGGFFPLMISVLVMAIGAVVAIKGFWTAAEPETVLWRPLLAVAAAVVVFALTVQLLGLLPAVLLTVAVSALGDPDSRPLGTVAAALVISFGVWLIFSAGLGLPIVLVRGLF
jgi:hypothetical protein